MTNNLQPAQDYLRDLNAVLLGPTSNPFGSFYLGVLNATSIRAGAPLPDRACMERTMLCKTIQEAEDLAAEWVAQHGRPL